MSVLWLLSWVTVILTSPWALAQEGGAAQEKSEGAPAALPPLKTPLDLPLLGGTTALEPEQPAQFRARYVVRQNSREGLLELTVEMAPGWHVYSVTQPDGGPSASRIQILTPGVELLDAFAPDAPPRVHFDEIFDMNVEEHSDRVTWSAPIRLPDNTDPATFPIQVRYDGQVCKVSCIPLRDIRVTAEFAGYVEQLPQRPNASAAVSRADAVQGRDQPETNKNQRAAPDAPGSSLTLRSVLIYVGFGLLGGFLLNFMPCVLPVVGLKIFAFAQQAHQDRRRVFLLNVWFSLGILAVFAVLATLAAGFNMSWGQQFTHTWFKVSMIVLVFAMALSFLGVWELTVPSFLGRGKANELQEQEGYLGAFFKGVFTTLLSTPCSGPALGAVFAFILGKPVWLTYLLFASVGLGMAAPYLVLGANPQWLRFLPKPGNWMETFKELMGFVLLATTVFLFTTIHIKWFLPTFSLLIGVWFACWWIGRVPLTASTMQYIRGWLFAITVASAVGLFSFTWLAPVGTATGPSTEKSVGAHQLPWQPYSPAALDKAIAEEKTVLVDFTAQWCLTCKYNLWTAINTKEVKDWVEKNGVVTLLADWTDENEEIKRALHQLNANSIPLLAIYPAGRPQEVIVLRDVITKSQLLEALKQAGPSQLIGSRSTNGAAQARSAVPGDSQTTVPGIP
jgi:thiol:disulfide interchange protein